MTAKNHQKRSSKKNREKTLAFSQLVHRLRPIIVLMLLFWSVHLLSQTYPVLRPLFTLMAEILVEVLSEEVKSLIRYTRKRLRKKWRRIKKNFSAIHIEITISTGKN